MTSETIQAIRNETITIEEERQTGVRKTEVLFGVIMAVTAISGIWGAVSLLISWFMAS